MMSKKAANPRRKPDKKDDKKEKKEWPVVVYMWSFGLGILGYLIVGEGLFEVKPHPIHWLSGLVSAFAGIGIGWLWYRWRGDVF
ncbi:MAG: hypothetical protein FJZ86_15600 [Chloroflexi bacterium]|nr:hypothetical protein [Chloroflexota bacterium]